MSNPTFTPLWSTVSRSSIWLEPYHVRIVFMTMLAMKNQDHVYRGDTFNLSRDANVPEVEVIDAIKVLSSPDTRRVVPQAFDGRRIEECGDGWRILNGQKYQSKMSEEMKRHRDKVAQAKWRESQKALKKEQQKHGKGPLKGEPTAVKALEGGNMEEFDRMAADHQVSVNSQSAPQPVDESEPKWAVPPSSADVYPDERGEA